jgi:hypothetical protein
MTDARLGSLYTQVVESGAPSSARVGSFGVYAVASGAASEARVGSLAVQVLVSGGAGTSSKLCYIEGPNDGNLSSFYNAYTRGHTTLTNNFLCYIPVNDPATDNQLAYIKGWRAITDLQRCFIISIIDTPTGSQPLFHRGHGTITGSQNAYIEQWTITNVHQPAFIVAPEPVTPSQNAFVRGTSQGEWSENCYMFGRYQDTESQLCYIRVGHPLSHSQPAYLHIYTRLTDFNRCYIPSVGPATINPKHCFIHAVLWEGDTQPAFIQIQTVITDGQPCYINIATPADEYIQPKRCYIRSVGNVTQPLNAFVSGIPAERSGVLCYMNCATGIVDSQPAFIHSILNFTTGSQLCFLFETGLLIDSQPCYINGERIGEVDATRRAFIEGRSGGVPERVSVDAYIVNEPGIIDTSSEFGHPDAQRCFIDCLGLLADIPMDDGKFDYGAVDLRDLSEPDEMDATSYGIWVQGPFVEVTPDG